MRKCVEPGMVALPDGLKSWMQAQGPKVWHGFAQSVEFDAPDATIDVLLAAHWIAEQPEMDRATGLLLLAHALKSGLHIYAPPAMDDRAARAFCIHLHQRLALSQTQARLPVTPADQVTIARMFSAEAPLALPTTALKTGTLPQAYRFHANRPYLVTAALNRAA